MVCRRLATSRGLRPMLNVKRRACDEQLASGTPCADHRRRHRHRRRRRDASCTPRAPSSRCSAAGCEPLERIAADRRRHGDPVRRHRPRRDRPRVRRGARRQRPDRHAHRQRRDRRQRAVRTTTRESWDRIIATNLTAAFDCAQAGASRPARRARTGGWCSSPRSPACAACPMPRLMPRRSMALLGLMRSLAAELPRPT